MANKDKDFLANAIVEAVDILSPPESGEVAAVALHSESISVVKGGIHKACAQVQKELKQISHESAASVDGWVQQAKKLQQDIENSRKTAGDVMRQAEEASISREQVQQAYQRIGLLEFEVDFSECLLRSLTGFKDASRILKETSDQISSGHYAQALEKLQQADAILNTAKQPAHLNVISIFQQRVRGLHETLVSHVGASWDQTFTFDQQGCQFAINPDISKQDLEEMLEISSRLGILDGKIAWLSRGLSAAIFQPLLLYKPESLTSEVKIQARSISIVGQRSKVMIQHFLGELAAAIEFFDRNLPSQMTANVSQILMPSVVSHLTSQWLPNFVPSELERIQDLQALLQSTKQFAEKLASLSWSGASELQEWADQGPKLYLTKRRELAIAVVRKSLSEDLKRTRFVERIEKQMISDVTAPSGQLNDSSSSQKDDWNSAWQDEANDGQHKQQPETQLDDEDEDASAWEIEEDGDQNGQGSRQDPERSHEADVDMGPNDSDEDSAWGWDEGQDSKSPEAARGSKDTLRAVGSKSATQGSTEIHEITLKETYTITAVPDQINIAIQNIVQDAKTLRHANFQSTILGPAAAALFSLPTLILAGFRALAINYYMHLIGGDMYLYNDCVRLAAELTTMTKQQADEDELSDLPRSAWPSIRMKLESDIVALESFGRRAYAREMESQRTILRDLLDGTQGFNNCSEAPYAAACESAIGATVDRVRDVENQWTGILSRSATLQSLGSLVSTIIGKVILDIEDLSDISEAESRHLRNHCNRISKLNILFMQENPTLPMEQTDMTGVYVPSWFKFQYLSEIMDSSLADIRHFWTDGGLKLEFEAEEVVDLVQALFAESDYRKKTIAEIRASSSK